MTPSHQFPRIPRRSWRGQNLSGTDFRGINLSGVDFTEAILDGADLSYADLRGTIFRRCSLVGANLQFSRSGIAPRQSILLRSILLIISLLIGASAGFVGSSTMGLLINESKVFAPYAGVSFVVPWHTLSGLLAFVYITCYSMLLLLTSPVRALLVGFLAMIFTNVIVSFIVVYSCVHSNFPTVVAGQLLIAVGGTAILEVFEVMFLTFLLAIIVGIINSRKQILIAAMAGVLLALTSVFFADSSVYLLLATVTVPFLILYVGFRMGFLAKSEEPEYSLIYQIYTFVATYYGTSWQQANLTDANLAYALLTHSNLSAANLNNTNIHGVQQLDSAKTDRTILANPLVRNLLVTHQAQQGQYIGCDLHGAYLVNSDLTAADFTNVNFSDANLQQANLAEANLTRALAIGTNFQGANLTGACIADWSIDRTTQLADINCDYVYLQPLKTERTPASGNFVPGDFTRLFQEVCNTVDLIFQRGVNWVAFGQTWQQVQVENAGVDLAIRSIENKGEGTIVIKVDLPLELDKAQFHQEFDLMYILLLQAIESRYQAELTGRDREISVYREQQEQLQGVLQSLVSPNFITSKSEQLVTLKLNVRDINHDLVVAVEIGDRGATPRAAAVGMLNNGSEVICAYRDWQAAYRQHLGRDSRIEVPFDQDTNLSDLCSLVECQRTAQELKKMLNSWLDQADFKPIKELMLQELQPAQSIHIILQVDDLLIRQLPWQLWSFFEQFPLAEVAIASNTYQSLAKLRPDFAPLNILAIMGDSLGIDLIPDQNSLIELSNAQVEFLLEPTRQSLNDKLWSQSWDMVFFAGHSCSDVGLTSGQLKINATDRLNIAELKYALKQSIEQGLRLVILNSCDGLGLATELIAMQLPQAIVMREPVPDVVAQQFLQNFLIAYTSGLPLYHAVRLAREQLQGLEDKYPCATWLPVICQNPADI
jgi:uncharacterized protein YjbI with pentapeptide repeats